MIVSVLLEECLMKASGARKQNEEHASGKNFYVKNGGTVSS